MTDQIRLLCAEFGIRIVDPRRYPQPGETRAVRTLERILLKRGEGHLRLVLSAMSETKGNNGLMDEAGLWAVSDLFTACADLIENDAGAAFDLLDELPLGPIMAIVNELSGVIPQRPALVGILYFYLRRLRQKSMTSRSTSTSKALVANRSQVAKGQPVFTGSGPRLSAPEKIEAGRMLLAKKQELGWGSFQRWVAEESGYSYDMARKCMRMAREAAAGGEIDAAA